MLNESRTFTLSVMAIAFLSFASTIAGGTAEPRNSLKANLLSSETALVPNSYDVTNGHIRFVLLKVSTSHVFARKQPQSMWQTPLTKEGSRLTFVFLAEWLGDGQGKVDIANPGIELEFRDGNSDTQKLNTLSAVGVYAVTKKISKVPELKDVELPKVKRDDNSVVIVRWFENSRAPRGSFDAKFKVGFNGEIQTFECKNLRFD